MGSLATLFADFDWIEAIKAFGEGIKGGDTSSQAGSSALLNGFHLGSLEGSLDVAGEGGAPAGSSNAK